MPRHQNFPLFKSHLDLAHHYWESLVKPGDLAIDATCGNGHDSLILGQLTLCPEQGGRLIVMDKQPQALESTRNRLKSHFPDALIERIRFVNQCHTTFPDGILESSVALIVYNLGYLPGGDKHLTTMRETTIKSINTALSLIKPQGAISITCYPGHTEGRNEEEAVLEFAKRLDPGQWSCCYHRWMNRHLSPSLLLIQRSSS